MKLLRSVVLSFVFVMAVNPLAMGQEIFNPLDDARIGEWVLYEMPDGSSQKMTVVKVDDKGTTIKMELITSGKPNQEKEKVFPKNINPLTGSPDAPKPVITDGKAVVKGKELKCKVVSISVGRKVSQYVSPDIPVVGVIKVVVDDDVKLKLKDYGTE